MFLRIIILLVFFVVSCSKNQTLLNKSYEDGFNRQHLGTKYFDTIGKYLIIHGALNIRGAYNHPLWFKIPLPINVDITLDVWTLTDEGDIKIELFGDGKSLALNKGAYVASGYVFCQGGWHNNKTFIAKRFEHAKNLLFTKKIKALKAKKYHWKITSRLNKKILYLTWYIDGKKILQLKDIKPLYGKNNRYFAFNNWESDVFFDNLKISPIK